MKLHALMYGVPRDRMQKRIDTFLRLVELEERAHDLVRYYSGGMRRRLELARGLLHSPTVLFLDEPTLGLDPGSREHVWGYIEELVRERELSIIITTHYMEEAERLCDRVAIIDMGRIVALDSPEKLKESVGGEVLRLKISNPVLDSLDRDYVKKVERKGDYLFLTIEDAGKHLQEILRDIGGVEGVELRTPTLNDVFLHYTGREIREGSPEGSYGVRMIRARAKK
jgi:ABC-2 type transport system ATP-binding protein